MKIVKVFISKLLAHPSWAGIGVLVALIPLVASMNISNNNLEIINYQMKDKGIYFSVRNNLEKQVIINHVIITVETIKSSNKCYTAIPVEYTVNLKTKNDKFKINGLLTKENTIQIELNQIVNSKHIELFVFKFSNFSTRIVNKCNTDRLMIGMKLFYDNSSLSVKKHEVKM